MQLHTLFQLRPKEGVMIFGVSTLLPVPLTFFSSSLPLPLLLHLIMISGIPPSKIRRTKMIGRENEGELIRARCALQTHLLSA